MYPHYKVELDNPIIFKQTRNSNLQALHPQKKASRNLFNWSWVWPKSWRYSVNCGFQLGGFSTGVCIDNTPFLYIYIHCRCMHLDMPVTTCIYMFKEQCCRMAFAFSIRAWWRWCCMRWQRLDLYGILSKVPQKGYRLYCTWRVGLLNKWLTHRILFTVGSLTQIHQICTQIKSNRLQKLAWTFRLLNICRLPRYQNTSTYCWWTKPY